MNTLQLMVTLRLAVVGRSVSQFVLALSPWGHLFHVGYEIHVSQCRAETFLKKVSFCQ